MNGRGKRVKERWTDALTGVPWDAFEHLVARHYAAQGYRVEHSGTGNGGHRTDGGIDLKLYRDDQYIVVQCKHWNVLQVPHNAVHELIGVMHTQRATGAILITSGEFTRAAKAAAFHAPSLQLIDGVQVRTMLRLPQEEASFSDGAASPSWTRTGKSGPRKPSELKGWMTKLVLKIVIPTLTAAIAYVYIQHVLQKYSQDTQEMIYKQQTTAKTHSQQESLEVAPVIHSTGFESPQLRATGAARQPPTYPFKQNTVSNPPTSPSDVEDMKEWERKNAESMKILEKTTPVLGGQ